MHDVEIVIGFELLGRWLADEAVAIASLDGHYVVIPPPLLGSPVCSYPWANVEPTLALREIRWLWLFEQVCFYTCMVS